MVRGWPNAIYISSDTNLTQANPYPAILMGVACIGGGITGYLKTGSKPSLIAGSLSTIWRSLTHANIQVSPSALYICGLVRLH
jgi:hypothetical protein